MFGAYVSDKLKSPFSNNYQYSDEVRKGIPFDKMANEAQASMISDYYRAVQGKPGRYATLPVEVYQSIIPESYVPSFGRSPSDDLTDKKASSQPADSHQEANKALIGLQDSSSRQRQRISSPRSKPSRPDLPEIPQSNKPLMSGAQDFLPPSFSKEDLQKHSGSGPVRRPSREKGGKVSPTGRIRSLPGNPFDPENPNLKQQAEMLERNPARARQLIVAARRDPEMFGYTKVA
ncbi:hypothetical protein LP7551_01633 [Roseibium album]|nr:hypothetical protein LP7551_01633 [Roseibium album]